MAALDLAKLDNQAQRLVHSSLIRKGLGNIGIEQNEIGACSIRYRLTILPAMVKLRN